MMMNEAIKSCDSMVVVMVMASAATGLHLHRQIQLEGIVQRDCVVTVELAIICNDNRLVVTM